MSYLTLKTPFLSSHSSSSSSVLASCQSNQLLRLCSSSSLYVARKRTFNRGKLRWRAESQQQDSSQNSNSSDSQQPNGSVTSRRDILLEYVKNVQPEFMELFVKRAPQQECTISLGIATKFTASPEKIDAIKYIELLEAEVEELNRQVERISANGSNELLDYLKSLEPQNLKTSVTETSAPELAKLLYWLMVVGYSIRNIEVRFDMERVLGSPPKRQELPPAENI
ncbi:hypothetical protein L2E82_36372 [Cichorium intybus]|uniref:Uncharacterized protein n=1 Tax=Cichorium intybus TaxID=13427 RepID=A0ACB9BRI4_CICIN|nr:hypothetical protein L2E82_36372 [Cichorium intybus]